jgi:hypothetical protein
VVVFWIGLVAAGVALVAGLIVFNIRRERRRREELRAAARKLNLQFSAEEDAALKRRLAHFQLFSRGHGKKVTNVIRGRATRLDIVMLEYRFTIGGGQHSQTLRQTVALFETKTVDLPAFSVRPEHMFHKLGQLVGYQDIDFDSSREFSKRYLLRGDNERAIRKLFTKETLGFFERADKICVEAAEGQLIYYRPGKRVTPPEVEAFLTAAVEAYATIVAGRRE